MGKKLVAYFSASGVTAKVARMLAAAVDGDLQEIRPKVPYTKEDLNWMNRKSRSSVEMNNRDFRPEMEAWDIGLDAYDVIFLGFPIWWYVAPTIINTFLESADFSGKTIVLFATSGGSKFGKTAEQLRPSVSPDTRILEGKLLNGKQTPESLKAWVDTLAL